MKNSGKNDENNVTFVSPLVSNSETCTPVQSYFVISIDKIAKRDYF